MINTREIASEYRLSHWAGIMQERSASGLSIRAYCKSIGLHENVYHYWQRKLREAACGEMVPAPVSGGGQLITPEGWAVCAVTPTSSASTENAVTIEIGKSRIVANCDTDFSLLEKVCRMLSSLC